MPIVRLRKEEWEVPAGITVRDVILKAGQRPEAMLAMINGQLVNEETIIEEEDRVKLIAVISGGGNGEIGELGNG